MLRDLLCDPNWRSRTRGIGVGWVGYGGAFHWLENAPTGGLMLKYTATRV